MVLLRPACVLSTCAALLLGTAGLRAQSSFTPLPLDVTGYFSPAGVSADGSTVVGGSYVLGQGNKARRWRLGIGFDDPSPDPSLTASWASGVSADGSTVAGGSGHAAFGDLEGWMRYGTSVGHVGSPSGHDTSDCLGVSADGVTGVGYGGTQANPNLFEAARYTEQGDWKNMGFLPGGNNSKATAASANGAVIVGWSNDAALSISRAFRWTAPGGMASLGNLPSGTEARARGVNGDGSVVVGDDYVVDAQFHSTQTAWRWTAAGGMVGLGQLPGRQASLALAVSPDGQYVVGTADDGGSYSAFLWDAAHGMRRLRDVLVAQGLSGLAGFQLDSATAIAGSGPYAIAGEGTQGWVARFDPAGGGGEAWADLGGGLGGTAGTPHLAGTGTLAAGSAVSITLTSARATAFSLLFVGSSVNPTPFKGGQLLPVPVLASLPFTTSAAGKVVLSVNPWPPGLPAGTQLAWQFAVQDPLAPLGAALSNGLLGTTP